VWSLTFDQTAIEAAKQQLVEDSSDTRQALKDLFQSGAELLAADRQAVREAQGNPDALQAARDKLKADRSQLRHDLTAARDALRDDTAEGRAALKDSLTSLRDHLRQLRTDLQNAGVISSRPAAPASEPSSTQSTPGNTTAPEVMPPMQTPVQDPIQPPAAAVEHGEQPPASRPERVLTLTPEKAQTIADTIQQVTQACTAATLACTADRRLQRPCPAAAHRIPSHVPPTTCALRASRSSFASLVLRQVAT
jgi:hypothetical protein